MVTTVWSDQVTFQNKTKHKCCIITLLSKIHCWRLNQSFQTLLAYDLLWPLVKGSFCLEPLVMFQIHYQFHYGDFSFKTSQIVLFENCLMPTFSLFPLPNNHIMATQTYHETVWRCLTPRYRTTERNYTTVQ